jgi:hypothetical protein
VSFRAQQRVTGVVVNQAIRPPRKLRRQIRAAVHSASVAPSVSAKEEARLQGYLSYFSMYPDLDGSNELRSMKFDLARIAAARTQARRQGVKRR